MEQASLISYAAQPVRYTRLHNAANAIAEKLLHQARINPRLASS